MNTYTALSYGVPSFLSQETLSADDNEGQLVAETLVQLPGRVLLLSQ